MSHLYPAGAARGSSVEVTAAGTFERWPVRVWVEGKGVEVKVGKAKGTLVVTVAADAAPGPRWLRLHDEQGASVARRFVVGTLPEVAEREPNDDFRKPQALAAAGVVVNGVLQKTGDVDCFAVPLRKGQTLVASVEAHRPLGSPMDGVLQIVSDRGDVLAENNDHRGLDPQVVFRAPADGTYVARLFAFPAVPDAAIRFAGGERFVYRLTLTAGGFAEHAMPLAVPRASPASVALVGWNLPDAARSVPVVPGEEVGTAFLPGVAGVAAVRLEPHATLTRGDGGGPQELTLPVTVTGRLAKASEAHTYRFRGRKGQRVAFEVESARLGFAVDAVLRVTDAGGKALGEARARALGTDPELTLTLPADGVYQAELRDLYGHAGPRHLYRLRCLKAEADFGLSVAADRFAVAPGKSIDIPVTLTRLHGFAGPVELVAEGLPPGVTAETVPSPRGPTLRLHAADKAAGAGPLRISGRAKGLTRPARATLAEYGTATTSLWLSVTTTPVPPTPKKKRR